MVEILAIFATIVLLSLAVFQLLLAVGQPLGRFAWGGRYPEVLPVNLRIASCVSIIIYGLFAVLLLNQAGLMTLLAPGGWVKTALWVVTVYLFVGVLMNAISRSRQERFVMTPVAMVLAASFLLVVLNT